jgi:hypothetical protein
MTINNFIEHYTKENLVGESISIGTTALRNYIKEHRVELEDEKLVKCKKKLSSMSIDIINPEGLYKKIA